jgi:hypothetical protein
VQTTLNTSTETHGPAPTYPAPNPTRFYANRYLNPYVGYEGRLVGLGIGAMLADHPFDADQSLVSIEDPLQMMQARNVFRNRSTTWHVRLGGEQRRLTLRWMEDVPLESEGHFSADLGFRPSRQIETGLFVGLAGPYNGAMFGVRGRVWLTPGAALQIKASTAGGESGECGVYGSVMARLPGVH